MKINYVKRNKKNLVEIELTDEEFEKVKINGLRSLFPDIATNRGTNPMWTWYTWPEKTKDNKNDHDIEYYKLGDTPGWLDRGPGDAPGWMNRGPGDAPVWTERTEKYPPSTYTVLSSSEDVGDTGSMGTVTTCDANDNEN